MVGRPGRLSNFGCGRGRRGERRTLKMIEDSKATLRQESTSVQTMIEDSYDKELGGRIADFL